MLVSYPWFTKTTEDDNNSTRVASTEFVQNNTNNKLNELKGGVDPSRDTLKELSDVIDEKSDENTNFSIAVAIALG